MSFTHIHCLTFTQKTSNCIESAVHFQCGKNYLQISIQINCEVFVYQKDKKGFKQIEILNAKTPFKAVRLKKKKEFYSIYVKKISLKMKRNHAYFDRDWKVCHNLYRLIVYLYLMFAIKCCLGNAIHKCDIKKTHKKGMNDFDRS